MPSPAVYFLTIASSESTLNVNDLEFLPETHKIDACNPKFIKLINNDIEEPANEMLSIDREFRNINCHDKPILKIIVNDDGANDTTATHNIAANVVQLNKENDVLLRSNLLKIIIKMLQ